MTVKLPKNYKDIFTLREYEQVQAVKELSHRFDFNEEAETVLAYYLSKDKEICEHGSYGKAEIIKLDAEIIKDSSIEYNGLDEIGAGVETGYLNIQLKIMALLPNVSFIVIEIPLTEIWRMCINRDDNFKRAIIHEYKAIS
jgi:hypothetical protein